MGLGFRVYGFRVYGFRVYGFRGLDTEIELHVECLP